MDEKVIRTATAFKEFNMDLDKEININGTFNTSVGLVIR